MQSAMPSDWRKLKTRFEAWRKTRAKRSKTPDRLLKAVAALSAALTDGDALHSLTPDRDRPAPSPDDSAARSWRPDIPRPTFDHVRAFSDSLLLEQMNRPRRLTSRPSPSANRSENFHQLRTGDPRLCF